MRRKRNTAKRNACTVCALPTVSCGYLFPGDSHRFGAPAGKQRLLIYDVCEQCTPI